MLDDNLPELAESFQITLVSAESGDGKPGSTPTSGASIDPNNSVNTVTVTASDHPYGIYSHAQKQYCYTFSFAIFSNNQSLFDYVGILGQLNISNIFLSPYPSYVHNSSPTPCPPTSITPFPSFSLHSSLFPFF